METSDEERPLLDLQPPPQAVGSEYTNDGSVDINNRPGLKHCTGNWWACAFIIGVEFCECVAFLAISTNLVTYLTNVLHESKVAAARNVSALVGASFLTPLFGAFTADTYLGRYWTIVGSLLFYIAAMIILTASVAVPVFSTSSNHGGHVHRAVFYLGLYLAAIAGGGVKPCTAPFGADQFDPNDPVELAKKGSLFNWFFDRAAIVPSDNESTMQMSSWRLCTVTQVEELKMMLSMSPTWGSFVIFFAVTAQLSSTVLEQGMFMDNRVGSFVIPPASMSIFGTISVLILVPVYEAILVPLARRFTGNDKGFSQPQRLGIGLALSMLAMVYAALLEMRRLAVAEEEGLRHQSLPVPMSILWQAPIHVMHGAANVFGLIGVAEFFYDRAPVTMKSLCSRSFQLLAVLTSTLSCSAFVAVATTRGGAPGWIPDNLNEGHLDYFFWMMATLSLLNLSLFVRYSMRCTGKASC